MNAERTLVQAKVKVKVGDRTGAVELIEAVITNIRERKSRRKKRVAPTALQLEFAALVFHCDAYDVDLTAADCVQRARKVYPSGGRKDAPCWRQCARCEQGKAIALACPGVDIRPASQWPDVLPASQRMAKRAKALLDPEDKFTGLDPYEEINLSQREDPNDWKG
jgi:hypothetical protein